MASTVWPVYTAHVRELRSLNTLVPINGHPIREYKYIFLGLAVIYHGVKQFKL